MWFQGDLVDHVMIVKEGSCRIVQRVETSEVGRRQRRLIDLGSFG